MTVAPSAFTRALAAAAIVTACTGCPAIDVVVGEDEAGPEAGPQDGGPQTCSTNSDCTEPAYCAKSTCSATQGVCELPPLNCDDTEKEVCGCDGVIYWNDCLRQRDGVVAALPGECTTHFARCGGPQQDAGCPVQDAVCGRLDPGGGGGNFCMMPPGVCWVLPDTCPTDTMGSRWVGCSPLPFNPCTDLCDAVRSQRPYARALPQQCQ
jgi:hypothetical protein